MQSKIFYPIEEHSYLISCAKEIGIDVVYTKESGDVLREATISHTHAWELYNLGRLMLVNKRLNELKHTQL